MLVSPAVIGLGQLTPEKLRSTVGDFLPKTGNHAEKVSAIEAVLRGVAGQSLRRAMAEWIVDGIVPVSRLVPDAYAEWRPPVRDAMAFVVERLSPARLASKLLEQFELPENTSAEARLLRLIAKVPGLQKLGQVIARNQHLRPALRSALARLENGIRDVELPDIRAIIEQDLAATLRKFDVKLGVGVLSEASVSAVIRFTWRNPGTARRERGVFKVLKPHIAEYFAEDMDYLQALAQYFGDRHHSYGFPPHLIPDTFKKVRRLLQHEVNFGREQKTLREAEKLYRNVVGVRVPHLIPQLCSSRITALTEERGTKITDAVKRASKMQRKRAGEQLIEALVAFPLLSSQQNVLFHGDPHAGNLLYNNRTGELIIIDWALREHLTRDQRRQLAILFAMIGLRDPVGTCNAVLVLSQQRGKINSERQRRTAEEIARFLQELPPSSLPNMVDAMRLLERIAFAGVRFPASLVMLSKVMFTLDGILRDLRASETSMGFPIAGQLTLHWLTDRKAFRSPLTAKDWIALQCSAMLYTGRLWTRCEQGILDRLLPARSTNPA
jgi:ubiquinone biosynthesis protein